jgi:hypothetical protein
MTTLGLETRLVQNPALGAVLLWRFASKYSASHPVHAAPSMCLAALILPLVWHADTMENLTGTQERSGLKAFADKFTDTTNSSVDGLMAIHPRTARWRTKTLESLKVGFGSGLLRISPTGDLIPGHKEWQLTKQPSIVQRQVKAAEKLGAWFASLTLLEIASTLHVRF